jgi:hypothetical protein
MRYFRKISKWMGLKLHSLIKPYTLGSRVTLHGFLVTFRKDPAMLIRWTDIYWLLLYNLCPGNPDTRRTKLLSSCRATNCTFTRGSFFQLFRLSTFFLTFAMKFGKPVSCTSLLVQEIWVDKCDFFVTFSKGEEQDWISNNIFNHNYSFVYILWTAAQRFGLFPIQKQCQ